MIKDRFGYQSPEIIFPNFFRNRSILSRSIAASNFNLEIRCSEWAFSNRTASRSFSLCIFSTLCAFHSDNRKIADILRIPQGSVLRASAFVAPRRKAGAAQIPVQTCRTIGFHCHKIQNIRPSTIKKIGNIIPNYPCKPSSYDPHNQKIKSFI